MAKDQEGLNTKGRSAKDRARSAIDRARGAKDRVKGQSREA